MVAVSAKAVKRIVGCGNRATAAQETSAKNARVVFHFHENTGRDLLKTADAAATSTSLVALASFFDDRSPA
jgi:hypothetical protein